MYKEKLQFWLELGFDLYIATVFNKHSNILLHTMSKEPHSGFEEK